MHIAISTLRGRTLPWVVLKSALDDAFRLGLLERTIDSKDWPTDLAGAQGVKIKVGQPAQASRGAAYGAKVATAELETNEIQDLADAVGEIKKASAGQNLRFSVTVELGEGTSVPQGVVDDVNSLLARVKTGWKLG